MLTVNGRAELVVRDAPSCREILDRLEQAGALAAIRRGIEQDERGESSSLEVVETQLRMKHGFSRSDYAEDLLK